MNRTLSSRLWATLLFVSVIVILVFMSVLVYIVDPYLQFRITDNTYMLNPQYVDGGLIKNYDYDTLIIGSSMTQNFDMQLFRDVLNVKPLHVSLGGMTRTEMLELIHLADTVNKAQNYYVCIDSTVFTKPDLPSNNVSYLIDQSPLSTIQYLLSHEIWFYSLPVDLALSAVNALGINRPPRLVRKTSIDLLGNWEHDFSFGEDIVLQYYKTGEYAVTVIEGSNDELYQRSIDNIDLFFTEIASCKGNFQFFFPPYSALHWYSEGDRTNMYHDIKRYFVEQATALGYTVYDFQSQDFICDLSIYKDTTHYNSTINDWMFQQFVDKTCIITPDNIDTFESELNENIRRFSQKYAEILN